MLPRCLFFHLLWWVLWLTHSYSLAKERPVLIPWEPSRFLVDDDPGFLVKARMRHHWGGRPLRLPNVPRHVVHEAKEVLPGYDSNHLVLGIDLRNKYNSWRRGVGLKD